MKPHVVWKGPEAAPEEFFNRLDGPVRRGSTAVDRFWYSVLGILALDAFWYTVFGLVGLALVRRLLLAAWARRAARRAARGHHDREDTEVRGGAARPRR